MVKLGTNCLKLRLLYQRNLEKNGTKSLLGNFVIYSPCIESLPTDQVCRPGTQEWVVASSLPELSGGTPAPPPAATVTTEPTNNAVVSSDLVGPILVTLFCCLPFGIVSIVYASQVPGKLAMNDVAGAQQASKASKTWALLGFIIGLLVIIFWVVLQGAASIAALSN